MSEQGKADNEVSARVEARAQSIQQRLKPGLNKAGKIDLDALKEADAELFEVLQQFARSKTWRDDPDYTSYDVAKLLEAQSKATPLGAALENLSKNLKE
jgi:hypothetical protein